MSTESLSNVVELAPKIETPFQKTVAEIYTLVRDSLPLVGGSESAAAIMGCDRGDLTRALNRSGRYLAIEHVMAFTQRLVEQKQKQPEVAARINSALVRPSDMLVFPRVQITAAERARRHENKLRKLGAAMGIDLVGQSLEEI